MKSWSHVATVVLILLTELASAAGSPGEPKFAEEILPVFRKNCVACHRSGETEGGLNLESLAGIREGGDSGPAVVTGEPDESSIWLRATSVDDPMPPADNTVGAKRLDEQQLVTLKAWITQDTGGTATMMASRQELDWQPMPKSIVSIGAIDVSDDSSLAAIAQANLVWLVDLVESTQPDSLANPVPLVDPSLVTGPATDLDLVQAVAFVPGGELVITGGYKTVRVWKRGASPEDSTTPPWKLQRVIGGLASDLFADRVTAIAIHPDGKRMVVGGGPPSRGGEIRWIEIASGKPIDMRTWQHSDTVNALRFSPDGTTLASASADETIGLWDVPGNQPIRSLEGHTAHVLSLDWHHSGKVLASVGSDQTIRVWDATSGETQHTIKNFPAELTALRFVAATNQFAVGGGNGQVRLYDSSNAKLIRTISSRQQHIYGVAVFPIRNVAVLLDRNKVDQHQLIAGGSGGDVRLWNLSDGKQGRLVLE